MLIRDVETMRDQRDQLLARCTQLAETGVELIEIAEVRATLQGEL